MMLSLLTTSSIMLVVQKPLFINTSVIKMAYLLQSAIIAVKCFLKISALHFNQSKILKDYLIQTLIRFYKHIIQPEHIAFLRLVIEQTQCNATLSQYLYEKCALDVQNTIAQALLISHQSGEITCTSPDHSSLMYFGILRDIEWRMIMGMPLPPNETEVIDYINYCVDIFLKGHHKV